LKYHWIAVLIGQWHLAASADFLILILLNFVFNLLDELVLFLLKFFSHLGDFFIFQFLFFGINIHICFTLMLCIEEHFLKESFVGEMIVFVA
jgi:hypothetical protein